MDFFESYKFLRITLEDGSVFEFSLDREVGKFYSKAFIGIPTQKRWSELYPNLVEKRDEVLKAVNDFKIKKSGWFYKYIIVEYD
ncbi:MAG: hypothetical protein U0T77_05645 [Chitinophagales bacterium]